MKFVKFNFTVSERQVLLFIIDHLISLGGIYFYILILNPSLNKADLYYSFGYFLVVSSAYSKVFDSPDQPLNLSVSVHDAKTFVTPLKSRNEIPALKKVRTKGIVDGHLFVCREQ